MSELASRRVTFHPKLYLFRNETRARLIVGSNNLTEPGFFTNTEVSLQVGVGIGDQVIAEALAALESWTDTNEGLARELDTSLISRPWCTCSSGIAACPCS